MDGLSLWVKVDPLHPGVCSAGGHAWQSRRLPSKEVE
jgi:hypothetical protein